MQIGNCSKCGAAMHSPTAWSTTGPAPIQYSCNCPRDVTPEVTWVGPSDNTVDPSPWVGSPTYPSNGTPYDVQPWTPYEPMMPYTIPVIQPNIPDPSRDRIPDNFMEAIRRALEEGEAKVKTKKKKKKKAKKKINARKRKVAKTPVKAARKKPLTDKEKRDLLGGCEPRQIDLCCSTNAPNIFFGSRSP